MKVLRGQREIIAGIFELIFLTTRKFGIAFVRLILRKILVPEFTMQRPETNVRYEFAQIILKNLECKQRLFQPFLIDFSSSK